MFKGKLVNLLGVFNLAVKNNKTSNFRRIIDITHEPAAMLKKKLGFALNYLFLALSFYYFTKYFNWPNTKNGFRAYYDFVRRFQKLCEKVIMLLMKYDLIVV